MSYKVPYAHISSNMRVSSNTHSFCGIIDWELLKRGHSPSFDWVEMIVFQNKNQNCFSKIFEALQRSSKQMRNNPKNTVSYYLDSNKKPHFSFALIEDLWNTFFVRPSFLLNITKLFVRVRQRRWVCLKRISRSVH